MQTGDTVESSCIQVGNKWQYNFKQPFTIFAPKHILCRMHFDHLAEAIPLSTYKIYLTSPAEPGYNLPLQTV